MTNDWRRRQWQEDTTQSERLADRLKPEVNNEPPNIGATETQTNIFEDARAIMARIEENIKSDRPSTRANKKLRINT